MFSSDTTEPGCVDFASASVGATLDVDTLALRRRTALRGRDLPGRCRGTVLARWGELCRRNFGDAALAKIRAGLEAWVPGLPECPTDDAWFPIGVQVELTDAVIDECLAGDPRPLEEMLRDDVRANIGRASALFLRSIGPGPVLARARQLHAHLYDVGQASAVVRDGTAVLVSAGTPLFAHPTWQLLQLFAHRGFLALTGRELRYFHASVPASDSFRVEIAWA